MHSHHASTAAQDALDMLIPQCAPCWNAILLTIELPPPLTTNAEPNVPLPNMTSAALVAMEEWRTMTSKAMQWKMKAADANKRSTAEAGANTPTIQNGRWGKKSYQPTKNNLHTTRI
jgi:hypothetical protein